MKKLLIIAAMIVCGTVQAQDKWYSFDVADNTHILLTNYVTTCKHGSLTAIGTLPTSKSSMGCYTFVGDMLLIQWTDNSLSSFQRKQMLNIKTSNDKKE